MVSRSVGSVVSVGCSRRATAECRSRQPAVLPTHTTTSVPRSRPSVPPRRYETSAFIALCTLRKFGQV